MELSVTDPKLTAYALGEIENEKERAAIEAAVAGSAELRRAVREIRELGVLLTILGFGMGNYKDDMLEELSNKGKGSYAEIEQLAAAAIGTDPGVRSDLTSVATPKQAWIFLQELWYNPTMIRMKERINHLDTVMAELAHAQMRGEIAMHEIRRESKDINRRCEEQGQRMEAIQISMDANIAEMKQDTAEMKRSMDLETRKMKKAWGDLANKMGTVAEDVVAPNIPRLAVGEFGMAEVEDMLPRAQRTSRCGEKRSTEYDIVCAGPGKVIVVEVKCTPTLEKIQAVPDRLDQFFDFFPEYEGRELIGIFASWSIDAKLLPAISAAGLYGIAMGDDTMDVVARPGGH